MCEYVNVCYCLREVGVALQNSISCLARVVCIIALLMPFYESIVSSELSLGMCVACRGLCMMVLNTKILGNSRSFMISKISNY